MSIIAKHEESLKDCEVSLAQIKSVRIGKEEEDRQIRKRLKELEAELPGLLAKEALGEISNGEIILVTQEMDALRKSLEHIPLTLRALQLKEKLVERKTSIAQKKLRWEKANRRYEELKREIQATPEYNSELRRDILQVAAEVGRTKEANELVMSWKHRSSCMSLKESQIEPTKNG